MSTGLLIGVTGRKRSGKSTIATILKIEHGFLERSFAEPLRNFTADLLGMTVEELDGVKEQPIDWLDGITPRQIMQKMGTEFGRQMIHAELWIRRALLGIEPYLRCANGVVISDVRFENEATAIREKGGVILHVTRPSAEAVMDLHASEAGVSRKFGDFFIHNDCHIDDLEDRVKQVLDHIHTQRSGQMALALIKPEDKL